MSSNRHDAKWAEDLTTVADETNPMSFPTGGLIHRSTRKALPWKPGRGLRCVADPSRVDVPSIYIECLFKHAKVKDPKKLTADKDSFLVKCLDINFGTFSAQNNRQGSKEIRPQSGPRRRLV